MIDLPNYLLANGISLKQVGNEYSCLCFAHDDKNPSMSVYRNGDDKFVAHCFSCSFHGDVYAAYCELNGLDTKNTEHFIQAKRALECDDIIYTGKPFATIENPVTKLTPRPERTMIIPDSDTNPPKMNWLKGRDGREWGEPDEVHVFRQKDGTHWMYEARWNIKDIETGEIKKEPRVFSYGRRGSLPPKWECAHHKSPRPLYGLDMIEKLQKQQIIVCEGARKAEAAQKLLPMIPCIGWAGGAQSWSKSDWSDIKDKNIILWPDADEPGRKCMAEIAQHLITQGCTCYILDTSDKPEAWDSVDAINEGWDTLRTLAWAKANKGNAVVADEKKTPEETALESDTEIQNQIHEDGSYDQPTISDIEDCEDIQFDDLPHTTVNAEGAYTVDGITWTLPADVFQEIQAPQINPDILPECIRDWVHDTAGVHGVDPSILALGAVVAAGSCLSNAIRIQPERTNPGWREASVLWGAIVGLSGSGKSHALKASVSRLKKIQMELTANAVDLEDDCKAMEFAYESQQKEYIKQLAKKDPLATRPERPILPEIPRIWFEDTTIQALAKDLRTAGQRHVICFRDELSGWFGSFDQFSNGVGSSDRPAWLEFYESEPRWIDRVGSGKTFVKCWGGSILGGITPSEFNKVLGGMSEDGLLQRFMIVNARQGAEGNRQPYNKAINDRYNNMLQRIFEFIPSDCNVTLSDEADKINVEIHRHARKLINTGMIGNGFCSTLSKYRGLAARLMLTFHAIECSDLRIHPQSCQVSGKTAIQVKRFMLEFLLPHSIAFYINIAGQSKIGHAVKKVAELCLLRNDGKISTRDINHGWTGWRHYKDYDKESILNALIENGWILPHPKARSSIKGFPTRFLVNPKIGEYHAARKEEEKERREIAVEAIQQCRSDFKNDLSD